MFLILLFSIFSHKAYAYLDPAAGSAIVYIVISILGASFFAIKGLLIRFMSLMLVKIKKTDSNVESRIVFYSEGKQYWNVFKPILEALSKKGVSARYLTSDKNDPGLKSEIKGVASKYIGSINLSAAYLASLDADFVGMTTPQLDVLTIKRSRKVKHYCHIVHAPIDMFTYRKFAFDYFDSVFCSGPHQIKTIRQLENIRGTHKKMLPEIGCTYYDMMLEKIKNAKGLPKPRPCILVAPTWKEYSLLHTYGKDFFHNLLLNSSYDVILRPHPQIYTSYPEVIKDIETEFSSHERFRVDRNSSGEEAMSLSDVLISDLSGIIWDYVYLFQKPVLIIQTPVNLDGFEGTEVQHPMWELESIPLVGSMVSDNEIDKIDQIVINAIDKNSSFDIATFRDTTVFNWGHAGEVAAEKVLEIVSEVSRSNL